MLIVDPPAAVVGRDPAGRTRLLAARTPEIWLIEMLFAASLAGSSSTISRSWLAPLKSTVLTPSTLSSAGTIVDPARASSWAVVVLPVACIATVSGGRALMSNDSTVDAAVRPRALTFASIVAVVPLTSVP